MESEDGGENTHTLEHIRLQNMCIVSKQLHKPRLKRLLEGSDFQDHSKPGCWLLHCNSLDKYSRQDW
jgi:hypothetical protein